MRQPSHGKSVKRARAGSGAPLGCGRPGGHGRGCDALARRILDTLRNYSGLRVWRGAGILGALSGCPDIDWRDYWHLEPWHLLETQSLSAMHLVRHVPVAPLQV